MSKHRMQTVVLPLVLALGLAMCLAHRSLASDQPSREEANVVAAMQEMYVAATNDDLAKFHSVAAPDFYSFDVGKRFNGDELMVFIKRAHDSGKVYVWQVTEPRVQIEGNFAWITYINRGSVQDSSGKKDLSWLESAVLRRDDGTWRIQFLHSTRVAVD